jgi:hypothetical protein
MDLRRRKRSQIGLVEATPCIAITDIRHLLTYAGRDRHRIRIRGGLASGLSVDILWTPLPQDRGGMRPWFACPSCDGPAARLYDPPAWVCRTCARLHYRSTREEPHEGPLREHHQTISRIEAIRRRLGVEGFWMATPVLVPPDHVPEATFIKLAEELWELERRACAYLTARHPLTWPDGVAPGSGPV